MMFKLDYNSSFYAGALKFYIEFGPSQSLFIYLRAIGPMAQFSFFDRLNSTEHSFYLYFKQ